MAVFAALALACIACGGPKYVPLSDLWGAAPSPSERAKTVITSGTVDTSGADECDAYLVEAGTRLLVVTRGALCEKIRTMNGNYVRITGELSVASSMPDVNLRPDAGGCEPVLRFSATRLEVVR